MIFNKQPYPQNVRYRRYKTKFTVLQLTAENHQNSLFHSIFIIFLVFVFLLEENVMGKLGENNEEKVKFTETENVQNIM